MGPPTVWMRVRQTLGRALRETGQAMDRLGLRTQSVFMQEKRYGDDDPFVYDDFLSRHRQLMPLLKYGRPLISSDVAYLAPCATMIGSVRIGAGSSVWYKAVLRADECENGSSWETGEAEWNSWELDPDRDIEYRKEGGDKLGGGIFIGENTNVQDGAIITARVGHTEIGDGVTIGHLAQIHSAKIESHCLIGMGSVVTEGCHIEIESFVAAGAVLPANTVVKSGELWAGVPAKKLRDLTAEQRQKLHYQADEYVKVAKNQSGVMELGGNFPGDIETRFAIASGTKDEEPLSISAGTASSEEYELAMPTAAREARQRARFQASSQEETTTDSSSSKGKALAKE